MANTKDTKEEKVTIMLPIIEGEDSEVVVGINEKLWKIKRGETVEVPAPVAEVLANSGKSAIYAEENKKRLKSQTTEI